MTDTAVKYLIVNSNPKPLTVIVEPWAEEVVLAPDSRLVLTALCDREGMLEVETDPNYLTMHLWTGCRAKVTLNGESLAMPSLLIPSP